MEHLQHFNLGEDPFRNEPLLRLFFEAGPQRAAFQRLERSVRQSRGLSVLVGDVGSGKTMVVRQLLEVLEDEVFEVSMMVVLHGSGDAKSIFARFARQLGIEDPGTDREAQIAAIYEKLAIIREDGRHAVLIIDDAEALASGDTLAEICGLLKLEYEDRRLLSLVLAGSPKLEAALARDPLLAQHVDVRVTLAPFDAETSRRYLAHRVEQGGGDPAIIGPDAVAALHELGRGMPGLMNTLADNALFEAFLFGRDAMARTDVERAHGDLGWNGAGAPAAHAVSAAPAFLGVREVDSQLDAIFEDAGDPVPSAINAETLPKDEQDLVVELLED